MANRLNTELEGTQLEKALALLKALELEESEIESVKVSVHNESEFTINGREFLVLNEEERKTEVTNYIKNSLWAFNASFLAQQTHQDLLLVYETLAKAYLHERSNTAILCLVERFNSLDSFVESAISADGYGHYLAHDDGREIEEGVFFIFRTN